MSKSKTASGGGGRNGTAHLEPIAFRPHRTWPVQLLLLLWRWAVELVLLSVLLLLVVKIHHVTGWSGLWSLLAAVGVLVWLSGVLYVIPATRLLLPGVFWCLVTRHRLRTFFLQGRVFNLSWRLPWILFVRPTPVGERVWVWLVPGLSVDDFSGSVEKLTAATWARTVRIERSRSVGALLRVDVVRRDPLMGQPVGSVLIPSARTSEPGAPVVAGPLEVPRTAVNLSIVPDGGKATTKKTGVNTTLTPQRKAKLSSQDGTVIPSTPPVMRGGEDVSDYV